MNSKIYEALGLQNTLLSHTSRTCGSAPTRQETKEYFKSLCLFLSDVYGGTEATGPQTTILETRKHILNLKYDVNNNYLSITLYLYNDNYFSEISF